MNTSFVVIFLSAFAFVAPTVGLSSSGTASKKQQELQDLLKGKDASQIQDIINQLQQKEAKVKRESDVSRSVNREDVPSSVSREDVGPVTKSHKKKKGVPPTPASKRPSAGIPGMTNPDESPEDVAMGLAYIDKLNDKMDSGESLEQIMAEESPAKAKKEKTKTRKDTSAEQPTDGPGDEDRERELDIDYQLSGILPPPKSRSESRGSAGVPGYGLHQLPMGDADWQAHFGSKPMERGPDDIPVTPGHIARPAGWANVDESQLKEPEEDDLVEGDVQGGVMSAITFVLFPIVLFCALVWFAGYGHLFEGVVIPGLGNVGIAEMAEACSDYFGNAQVSKWVERAQAALDKSEMPRENVSAPLTEYSLCDARPLAGVTDDMGI